MVESLKQLNELCQKPNYRSVGNWMARYIVRDLALPVTWLFLHTPITANQVTGVAILVGSLGVAVLACPAPISFLLGALLLQLWYLLDHVDGQIARYRKTASLTGRFYDFMMHHFIHGIVLFGLAFYAFNQTENALFVIWGFLAAISIIHFNLIHDAKYKTFFEKLDQLPKLPMKRMVAIGTAPSPQKGGFRRIYSLLHKLIEMHVLMNVLTLGAVLQLLLMPDMDFRFFLFLFYGVAAPIVCIVKLFYLIQNQLIDEEFNARFEASLNG